MSNATIGAPRGGGGGHGGGGHGGGGVHLGGGGVRHAGGGAGPHAPFHHAPVHGGAPPAGPHHGGHPPAGWHHGHHGPHFRGAHGVFVWLDGLWWSWDGVAWAIIETSTVCGSWSDPLSPVPAEVTSFAAAELDAADGNPVTERLADGRLYLFTRERGALTIRVCLASSGEVATVGSPPAPPVPVVIRQHPTGMTGVRTSTNAVRDQIQRDYLRRRVIEWARAATADVNHAVRGKPDPRAQIRALFAAAKRRAPFVKDPVNAETVSSTEAILCLDDKGACLTGGDCGNQLVVLGATAKAIGIPIRLRTIRYAGQRQAHIVLDYDASPRGDSVWESIDPSTESGVCSNASIEEQFITAVGADDEPPTFIGIGQPDAASTLGDPDTLGADGAGATMPAAQASGWAGVVSNVQAALDGARAHLRSELAAYAQLRADLGLPAFDTSATEGGSATPIADYVSSVNAGAPAWTQSASDAASKLLSTADFVSGALGDALGGSRALYFGAQAGGQASSDLYIGSKPGDPYRVLLAADASGATRITYYDTTTSPAASGTLGLAPILIGAIALGVVVVSIATAYAIAKYSETLAEAAHTDMVKKVSDNEAGLVAAGLATPEQATAQTKALADLARATQPSTSTGTDFATVAKWIGISLIAVAAVAGLGIVARAMPERRHEARAPSRGRGRRTDYGNAIRVVYLPVNQAWAVMWHDQVLSLHNRRADAVHEAERLTSA